MFFALIFATATANATDIAEEISIQSASGESPRRFPASNVLDGDTAFASRFASRANPDDLFLDLGKVWSLDHMNIAWGRGDVISYKFEIATRVTESDDWTTVFSGDSSGTTLAFEEYDVEQSEGQFIRVRGLSNSRAQAWTNITEVKAFGSPPPEEISIQSASGESPRRFPASNVLDGDTAFASRFASRANPDDLFLDLGKVWSLDHMNIAWGRGDVISYKFEIATRVTESDDWTTVFSGDSSGTTLAFEEYDLEQSEGQFIRVRGLSNSSGQAWTNITEVKAFGFPASDEESQETTEAAKLEHFGQPITLVGANIPWSSDSGFSADFGWYTPTDIESYEGLFSRIQDAGGNSARVWLHTTAQVTPFIDEAGVVQSLSNISSDEVVINQLRSVLDEAWERGVIVTFSLFSFDMFCDSYGDDFGYRTFLDIRRHQTMVEENYQSYIDNALIPIVNGLKDHPALFAYEVFNEPEGAITDMTEAGHFCADEANVPGKGLFFPLSLEGAQRFVNRVAAAVHEGDPNAKVTTATHTDFFTSFSNETLTSQPGADENGTLDFYELHHYPNYDNPPYLTNVDVYEADRPIIIGEYDLDDVQQESLFQVEAPDSMSAIIDQGYAGVWPWSLINDNAGRIEEAISNVPASVRAIDRDAIEACIQTQDASCYKQ